MTRNKKFLLWACAVALCWPPLAARADFKLVPIDKAFLEGEMSPLQSSNCRYDNNLEFKKLPDGVQNAKCGRLCVDGAHFIEFAAYGSQGNNSSVLDTIVFDTNGDKNLANDKAYTIKPGEKTAIEIKAPGMEMKTEININQLTSYGVFLSTSNWLKGTVDIDGRKVEAALFDLSLDGFDPNKPNAQDMLFLDLNGNGKFDIDFQTYEISEYNMLQPEMHVGGKLYDVKIDTDRLDVSLTAYKGETGLLALDLTTAEKVKSFSFMSYVIDGETMRMQTAQDRDFPIMMKTGEFHPAMTMVSLVCENGTVVAQCVLENAIQIEAGKTAVLKLGERGAFGVSVEGTNPKLSVKQTLESKNGLTYQQVIAIPKQQTTPLRPHGALVKIFDSKKALASEGEIEYG